MGAAAERRTNGYLPVAGRRVASSGERTPTTLLPSPSLSLPHAGRDDIAAARALAHAGGGGGGAGEPLGGVADAHLDYASPREEVSGGGGGGGGGGGVGGRRLDYTSPRTIDSANPTSRPEVRGPFSAHLCVDM